MIDAAAYRATETLKDGTAVVVRAIQPEDKGAILDAFKGLDRDSIYTRFFGYKRELTESDLRQITNVDFSNVVALVAIEQGHNNRLIGGGRYFRDALQDSAEVAFVTIDACHGRGVASLILEHLATIARAQGILRFEADVLARNKGMLAVFDHSGLPLTIRNEGAALHISMLLVPTP